MKPIFCLLISAVLFVAGCNRDLAETGTGDQPTQRTAGTASKKPGTEPQGKPKDVVWTPALMEARGGYMFENAQQFGAYVRWAQIVGTGVLIEWDGTKGKVRLESVFHGKVNDKSVSVVADGGIVLPKRGDKVLFLLAPRDGRLKLLSFCGASGMYSYSDDLAAIIKKSLKSTGGSERK